MTNRIFASQDPLDFHTDPLPYLDRETGARLDRPGWRTTIFRPRPEHRVELPHPTNRALVAMRDASRDALQRGEVGSAEFYRGYVTVLEENWFDADQTEHARTVATRLARLAAHQS